MVFSSYSPLTNMTMENPPFEEVFPIENLDFQCHVSFQGCIFDAGKKPGVFNQLINQLNV